jgi:mRNA-degrading endonuclease toxin of MazEF toxin-antitoxin module
MDIEDSEKRISKDSNTQTRNLESVEKEEKENKIGSCTGELSEEHLKNIQDELDRAKEENNFSSNSRCVIC